MSRQTRRALDRLYARLPQLDCQQKCAESCGPIGLTRAEWDRIVEAVGEPDGTFAESVLLAREGLDCPLLHDGACTVYEVRPAICRLWGLVESMECPHGCKPARYLTREEGFEVLKAAQRIGA